MSSMMAKSKLVRKQKVLEKETYVEEVGKIIQRDFFPDLEKLKALNDRNDTIKLQQIHATYTQGMSSERYSNPCTFENAAAKQPFEDESFEQCSVKVVKKVSGIQNMSLDEYLSLHTSEDNQSYEEIIAEADKTHRQNYPWLYQKESLEKNGNILSLDKDVNTLRSKQLDSWSYQDKNYLMYVPDGVELTPKEKIEMAKHKKEIVYSNTRLKRNPFDGNKNKEILKDMAHSRAKLLPGKFGTDGKKLYTETPKVNDFSFVRTPSPAPGVHETPLMTWGQIESTPFRLDSEDTLITTTPGISYNFPKSSRRERLALKLADKIDDRHRHQRGKQQLTTPLHHSSTLDRLQLLSPAAKKLASTKLRSFGSDRRLAGYYSPVEPRRYFYTPEIQTRSHDTSKNVSRSDKKKLKTNFGC